MILQSLYRYHQLLQERESENESIPRAEYSSVDVSFEVQLNEHGHVVAIIQPESADGKISKIKHVVPKQEKRSSGIKPYFLCDKPSYLFGAALPEAKHGWAYREAMRTLWKDVLKHIKTKSPDILALHSFLELSYEQLEEQIKQLADKPLLKSLSNGGLCVLKYAPTGQFLHKNRDIQLAWEDYYNRVADNVTEKRTLFTCLITGEKMQTDQIARLHPSIKNIAGAQSSGAAIVSFNKESFCSYGREQSYNAPTSKTATDAYGYVLNKFLSDPAHRVRMNDTTVVFWAESLATKEQDWMASLLQNFDEDAGQSDEDSIRTRVKSVVTRIRQGQHFNDTFADLNKDTTFYILGLSPNAARLSIRFWYTGTIGELGERVWRHYQDLSIVGLERSPTIRELLRETAIGHDWSNISPNIEGQMMRSFLLGLPYSRSVFAQLMNRIRAEGDEPKKGLYKIGAVRAAMIKAYLLRYYRFNKNPLEGEITMELNKQSKSIPYHLGRLFACLERTQESALGQSINASIRDRFWGAASATPANVFPRLLSLAQHHIAKDEKWGKNNDYRIQEVMNTLPPQFPKRLTLEEQGMFALGYYHQRQEFFTKKAEN
ncbi:type I-C CRISPR-associated protein Cas8c/Csd1 [Alicyclobacillus tolerans]|uniref:type I-C CRISPR-associated protein Cas8c/Csd1 n=1 Tax=Alicyclobacillus tolerans TaxID=90970 RepID=UPI003B7D2F39